MKVQIILLITLYTLISNQITNLRFEMNIGESHCFQESIPEKTIAEFEVDADKNVTVTLRSQDGKIIQSGRKENFKHSFTTDKYGYYEICIGNSNSKIVDNVDLRIRHGVGMKDYSSLARAKDLKPIDIEVKKLSDQQSIWKYYLNMNTRYERNFDTLLNSISSKIVYYSIILIVVMIVVGLMETIYLKKFMERRKVI